MNGMGGTHVQTRSLGFAGDRVSELCMLGYPSWFLVVSTTGKYCEPLGQNCCSPSFHAEWTFSFPHSSQLWPQMGPPPLSNLPTLSSYGIGLVWVWGWGRGNMSMTLKSYVGMGEAMGRKDTQDPAQESETTA